MTIRNTKSSYYDHVYQRTSRILFEQCRIITRVLRVTTSPFIKMLPKVFIN
jgi:hypothetical protein